LSLLFWIHHLKFLCLHYCLSSLSHVELLAFEGELLPCCFCFYIKIYASGFVLGWRFQSLCLFSWRFLKDYLGLWSDWVMVYFLITRLEGLWLSSQTFIFRSQETLIRERERDLNDKTLCEVGESQQKKEKKSVPVRSLK
jgi:hypothetical protein